MPIVLFMADNGIS